MNLGAVLVGATLLVGAWLLINGARAQLRLRRLQALSAKRSNGLAEFRKHFPDLPEGVVEKSHGFIQNLTGVAGFRLEPDDHLWNTLELDQGEVENEVESFLGKPAVSEAPMNTVAELVRALAAQQAVPADVARPAGARRG